MSLNPALTVTEINRIIDHSGAAVLVADAGLIAERRVTAEAPSLRLRVVIGGRAAGFVAASQLLEGRPTTVPGGRRTGRPLPYSSGTTGAPKGIARPRVGSEDPVAAADEAKVFGRALQFMPFDGVSPAR